MKTKRLAHAGLYLLLGILCFIFLMPIVWVVFSSFKPAGELFAWPPSLIGKNPGLDNYILALEEGDFVRYFVNTVMVSLIATLLTVVVNVMAGYVFAKYHFRGERLLFGMVMVTLMIPLEVIMIPIFKVIVATKLYDSLWGLIIPAVASPTAVFLVRQNYVPIPNELMVVSVLCIFSFMWRWNDYLWPKLVINNKRNYTLQLALANFSGEYSVDWNSLLAMSVISMIPVLIVFVTLQKYIIGGMTAGGVKG